MLNLMRHAPWVSLTGLYTAHVWALHGLTPDTANTWLGRCIRWGLMPAEQVLEALYGTSLEKLLVQRHRHLDTLSRHWLDECGCHARTGFVELPCGLASRTRRLASEFYGEGRVWIEADLPAVMRTRTDILGPDARVTALSCDALRMRGTQSLEDLKKALKPCDSVCVTMEGLLNYFDLENIRRLLQAQVWLAGDKRLRLLADVWPDADSHPLGRSRHVPARLLRTLTGSQAGLRGRNVHEIQSWFIDAGFETAQVMAPDSKGLKVLGGSDARSSGTILPPCVIVQADVNAA